jgi:hypothetical protein
VHVIAYAGDVVLIARTRRDLVEGFRSLESAAVRIGLDQFSFNLHGDAPKVTVIHNYTI